MESLTFQSTLQEKSIVVIYICVLALRKMFVQRGLNHVQFLMQRPQLYNKLSNELDDVYVVVQIYPWFKFYFSLFKTHYHTLP